MMMMMMMMMMMINNIHKRRGLELEDSVF